MMKKKKDCKYETKDKKPRRITIEEGYIEGYNEGYRSGRKERKNGW